MVSLFILGILARHRQVCTGYRKWLPCKPPKLPVDFREALQRHGRAVQRRQQIPAAIADRAGGASHARQHILDVLAGESLKLCLDRFGRVLLSAHTDCFLSGAKRFGHQGHDLVKLYSNARVVRQHVILDLIFHPRPPAVQLALFRKDEMDRSDWFRFFWIVLDFCFFNCMGSSCAGFSCVGFSSTGFSRSGFGALLDTGMGCS